MGYMALYMLLGFAVMFLGNYIYLDAVYEMGRELRLDQSHPYFSFINRQQSLLIQIYLVLASITFVFLMVASLILSHRIAGPINRVERYLEEVAAGNEKIAPVHLRKNDFFPEMEGIVNKTIAHFVEETDQQHASKDDPT